MKFAIRLLFSAAACLSSIKGFAQTDAALVNYLSTHRHSLVKNADSTLTLGNNLQQLLLDKMKGKRLFIYGQGWNHGLHLNNLVAHGIIAFFAQHGLSGDFEESSRSWVVEDMIFLQHPEIKADTFYADRPAFYRAAWERTREQYLQHPYGYYATDFERPHSFYKTLLRLMTETTTEKNNQIAQLIPYLDDTTYLTLSSKKFVQFYTDQQARFYKDSAILKPLLGDAYKGFKYLMGDPEPSTYTDNRDAMMASHILAQMAADGDTGIYFYSCGMAHSRPGKRDGSSKSTAKLLDENEQLKGKLVVMNLFCDKCKIEGDNWTLPFMKDEILASFQAAANADIVVFDLSQIPDQYSYIRNDYGQFLVYARQQ